MHLVILALFALALAVLIGCATRRRPPQPPPGPEPPEIQIDPGALEELAETVAALQTLMDHPELGGPGFLAVHLPRAGEDQLTVSAQFPNIREALYRRVAQGGTDPADLICAGVPEALFDHAPTFAADSGGMVLLTAKACPFPDRELDLRQRTRVLHRLTQALQPRFPELSIRSLGSELLLTPGKQA